MTKAKTVTVRLTPADIRAIDTTLVDAMESSCTCSVDPEYTDSAGYLGHDSECHVSSNSATYKRVQAIIDRAKATQ